MNEVEIYFNAEKNESLLFILVGFIACSISLYYFLKLRLPFYSGIGYAFTTIALIQVTVGISVYVRSPKDIVRVKNVLQNNTNGLQTEEIPRMNRVMKNFVLYRWIEIAFIFIGILLIFAMKEASVWSGVGLGLMVQSGFMLLLDHFAESRGKIYLEYLEQIIK
ncbi:MAG: hypothetical protein M0R68_12260 [Bacteroidetes bacterium]|nr:hypothetical protein [Bacteroidota bacterium]